ncbi:hypothetical protein BDN67DRAFT_1011080 [Paxillus ammoniavirescens]|nr:hypothetical protein BDN67DRAFT_1011080 [Paxillus ammoniavirescens]
MHADTQLRHRFASFASDALGAKLTKHVKQIALYAVLALSLVLICSVFLSMGKEYHCDCKKVCKGVLTPVTRAAFCWHEKYHEEGTSVPPTLQALQQTAGIVPTPRVQPCKSASGHKIPSTRDMTPVPSGSTTLDNRAPTGSTSNHVCSETPARDFDHDIRTFSPQQTTTNDRERVATPRQYQATVEEVEDRDDDVPWPSVFDNDNHVLQEEVYANVKLDDLCTALAFIFALQKASLDDEGVGMDPSAVQHLRNPPSAVPSFKGQKAL